MNNKKHVTWKEIEIRGLEMKRNVNKVVMLVDRDTREDVTASVTGRVDMTWDDCTKEQEVYNAVRTTHCATETIDTPFTPQDSQALWCDRW